MTDSKVIDFDEFRREQQGDPKTFRVGGHEYKMAPQIPAVLVLKVLRLQATVGESAPVALELFDDFGRSVFGSKVWDDLLIENHIDYEEVPALITAVIRAYAPKAEGESPTSETEASSSPSSKRGRGSKRTSSASTKSTS